MNRMPSAQAIGSPFTATRNAPGGPCRFEDDAISGNAIGASLLPQTALCSHNVVAKAARSSGSDTEVGVAA